jgi:hypothetical protein
MSDIYDYVIVGGGPVGITLSYTLSTIGKRCCLIDLNNSLGGCHRVTRSREGLFTEHGPRIYSNSYVNTIELLNNMNLNFYDIFTPYNFTISNIQGKTIKNFSFTELLILSKEFIKLIFGCNRSKKISVEKFMIDNNFSKESLHYADRLCRLTDGAGSNRYSLYNFLQLLNQQYFYTIYQPRLPNDIGLFKSIQNVLEKNSVDILLNTNVVSINTFMDKIDSIECFMSNKSTINLKSNNFVFAIPPKPYLELIKNNFDILSSYNNLPQFVENNTYINDIPVVFHWSSRIELPKVWGFPATEWGIAYIVLSDYMDFQDARSKTVITTCITKQNILSTVINKTPYECNEEELKNEVFRQLKISYPDIPSYDIAILHPTVKKINNKWIETDTAYVNTYHDEYIDSKNKFYNNLYFVGTHNGKSSYDFTSFESAVENSLRFVQAIEPMTKRFKIKNRFTVIKLIRISLLLLFVIILFYLLYKKRFNK